MLFKMQVDEFKSIESYSKQANRKKKKNRKTEKKKSEILEKWCLLGGFYFVFRAKMILLGIDANGLLTEQARGT